MIIQKCLHKGSYFALGLCKRGNNSLNEDSLDVHLTQANNSFIKPNIYQIFLFEPFSTL